MPESVGRLTALGVTCALSRARVLRANCTDDAYRDAGAVVADRRRAGGGRCHLQRQFADHRADRTAQAGGDARFLPCADLIARQSQGGTERECPWLSMELVPRISRAQSMDALSSQALVAGYRCALVAADRLPKFFPLLMTAAGTVKPAQVVVLGAGVAGLQAIATAKRLGAVVQAYDVRAQPQTRSASWGQSSSISTSTRSKGPAAMPAR